MIIKKIEEAGIPGVHLCTVTPISKTVGAPRILGAVAIPHPTGNPELSIEKEIKLREDLVDTALQQLQTKMI